MKHSSNYLGLGLLLVLTAAGCGKKDDTTDTPPSSGPAAPKEKVYTLQSGQYLVSNLTNLDDGCKKDPLSTSNPLTKVPFNLTNDGASNVAIDFCSGGADGVHGVIHGNQGTLSVQHLGRRVDTGLVAIFDQECTVDVTVTKDNTLHGHYKETQSNRNQVLRDATVDVPECETSFDFDLTKES